MLHFLSYRCVGAGPGENLNGLLSWQRRERASDWFKMMGPPMIYGRMCSEDAVYVPERKLRPQH